MEIKTLPTNYCGVVMLILIGWNLLACLCVRIPKSAVMSGGAPVIVVERKNY